jgi:hypothetical protein
MALFLGMLSPTFRNQLITSVFLGMSSAGFKSQLTTPNFKSADFRNEIDVIFLREDPRDVN